MTASISNKKLRYALNAVINAVENVKCDSLHHTPGQQHESGHLCKAEYNLQKQASILKEFVERAIMNCKE
jgi:hypothetical protein